MERLIPLQTFYLLIFLPSPFAELKSAVYDCFNGLAAHFWGFKLLLETPGFYQFILTRNTEELKEVKEWKFTIVQTMNETLKKDKSLLDVTRRKEIELFLKDGVFFVPTENAMQISTEM